MATADKQKQNAASSDTVPEIATPYGLIDIDSGNMIGSFATEEDALLAVAKTVHQFGETSNEVLSLSLFREDVPPEQGFIADGEELVQRALDAEDEQRWKESFDRSQDKLVELAREAIAERKARRTRPL